LKLHVALPILNKMVFVRYILFKLLIQKFPIFFFCFRLDLVMKIQMDRQYVTKLL